MKQGKTPFKFALSGTKPGISDMAQTILHLSELAEQLAIEDRTIVSHASGRAENVAEHSNMLAIVAPALAEQFFPELDANLVARYAAIHDAVEAYVGDTPTHDITDEGLHHKESLEKLGLEKLLSDFSQMPKFAELVESYETQVVPEARFVRVMDKCMPSLIHFANGGQAVRKHMTPQKIRQDSAKRAAGLRKSYPEFESLIALREELSELMAKELFN